MFHSIMHHGTTKVMFCKSVYHGNTMFLDHLLKKYHGTTTLEVIDARVAKVKL